MRPGRLLVAALAVVLTAACQGECEGARCADPSVTIGAGSEREVFLVEIAATPQERSVGLMNRTEVPVGRGMLFLFPSPVRNGFWMKNTLVELDIAFISGDRVLEVRRMTPCRADPCPITRPAADYDKALEVAAGGLASVAAGAPVAIRGTLPTPS